MTNLSTLDRKEQRSELRRPGTMSMRCTEKKNGVKEYKFTFRHHGFVAGSFIAVFRRNHYRAATTPYIKNRIESSNHLVCKINCGSSITSFVV